MNAAATLDEDGGVVKDRADKGPGGDGGSPPDVDLRRGINAKELAFALVWAEVGWIPLI